MGGIALLAVRPNATVLHGKASSCRGCPTRPASKPLVVVSTELLGALLPSLWAETRPHCGCRFGLDTRLFKTRQVAEDLGESVKILKVDTDENPTLSTQLQVGTLTCRR